MNKIAKERYGNRVQINQSLFNCHNENSKAKIEEFLKRADTGENEIFETYNKKQAKENSLCLFVIIINKLLVILKDMKYHGTKIIQQSL